MGTRGTRLKINFLTKKLFLQKKFFDNHARALLDDFEAG